MLRRNMLIAATMAGIALPMGHTAAGVPGSELKAEVKALERRYGGKLGVALLNTTTSNRIAYRGDERFPLCSTWKFALTACVLARVDRQQERLSRRVLYSASDLLAYSPSTTPHAGAEGMTVAELCEAAVTASDNTAANLLLDSVGGPKALTAYLRAQGDTTTRLDRSEPALNDVAPGDPRDTTTPSAMLETVRRLTLGPALSDASRTQLTTWLVNCKTGTTRLRAGLPSDWRIGDKTGSGPRNATNDVAVIWPPGRAPIVAVAYFIDAPGDEAERSKVLASIGRLAMAA